MPRTHTRIKACVAAVLLVSGCGEDFAISGQTVALVSLVRPGIEIAREGGERQVLEETRLIGGTRVVADRTGRALLDLDNGARIVVDADSVVTVETMDRIEMERGRIWVEASEGETVTVEVEDGGTLRAASSAISVVLRDGRLEAYTAAGETTYTLAGGNGLAREGEILRADGKAATVAAADLWTDWTGGLAEAGPQPSDTPMGIGEIFARMPGSLGVTRLPLVIRRHDVRVTIRGDLAITETVQEFFNPASETLEGIYKLRIPEDAVLQRFAVDRDGRLVDGYIKEKEKARADYQSYVYEGSTHDPALLEWLAAGSFKARIYPIKPGEIRVVAYRYVQWLRPSGDDGRKRTYVLPMGSRGVAPQIGEFSLFADLEDVGTEIVQAGLGARVDEGRVVFTASDFQPKSDFYLELIDVNPDLEKDDVLVARTTYAGEPGLLEEGGKETYFYTQFLVRPEGIDLSPGRDLRVAIVSDLSAATDPGLADLGLTFVDSFLKQLDEEDTIAVFAGDLTAMPVSGSGEGTVKATAQAKEAAIDALSRRATGGATDIGQLVTQAAAVVGGEPGGVVVYVGDAFPTVGEMDLSGLLDRMAKLPHPVRLYGVALGDESNLDLLAGLCASSGLALRVANRIEAAETAYRILADASVPVFTDVTFEIDGRVERLYPRRAVTLRISEPLAVIGRIADDEDPSTIRVKGRLGAKKFEVKLRARVEKIDDHGDLKLRWATRRLEALTQADSGREALVELGTRYQIITPYTSFYVPPAEEAQMLPIRPPFEIFTMPGEEGTKKRPGGIRRVLFGSAGVALSLLPYGCALRASKEEQEQAPEVQEKDRLVSYELKSDQAAQTGSSAPPASTDGHRDGALGVEGTGAGGGGQGYGRGAGGLIGGEEMKRKASSKSEENEPADSAREIGIMSLLSKPKGGVVMMDSSASAGDDVAGAYSAAWSAAPAITDDEAAALTAGESPTSLQGALDASTLSMVSKDNADAVRACYEDQLAIAPDLEGRVEVKLVVGPTGSVIDADVLSTTLASGAAESCILAQVRSWSFPVPESAGVSVANVPFNFRQGSDVKAEVNRWDNFGLNSNVLNLQVQASQQIVMQQAPEQQSAFVAMDNQLGILQLQARRNVCTAESLKPLEERVEVWTERLGPAPTAGTVVAQFHQARRNCEIRSMQDRRAYARLALGLLIGPAEQCEFMNRMKAYPDLVDYIRKKILEGVASPTDLAIVRQVCDDATLATQPEIDKILKSTTMDSDAKIKAIKKLIKTYPMDMNLKLVLLDMLEDAPEGKRLGEAKRLAEELRHHPYADDTVRTRVGEFYNRIGKPDEAKRCFSEIVEFSPLSPAARRRLGDLYRTYGWYEDAYRQYETLSAMVPSDETVLILMAEAAALAGRVDEAVRLAERVSQTTSTAGVLTPADVARLFNGLRLAELRVEARVSGDDKKTKDLLKRSRRAGVLRDVAGLKVVLKWHHPDVHLDLMVKDTGSEIRGADMIAEQFGVEWLLRDASRPGPMLLEIVRSKDSVVKESRATLYIIVREGEADETVTKIDVVITDRGKDTLAWSVDVDGKIAEAPVIKEQPIGKPIAEKEPKP